jgi:hypothetical protein
MYNELSSTTSIKYLVNILKIYVQIYINLNTLHIIKIILCTRCNT